MWTEGSFMVTEFRSRHEVFKLYRSGTLTSICFTEIWESKSCSGRVGQHDYGVQLGGGDLQVPGFHPWDAVQGHRGPTGHLPRLVPRAEHGAGGVCAATDQRSPAEFTIVGWSQLWRDEICRIHSLFYISIYYEWPCDVDLFGGKERGVSVRQLRGHSWNSMSLLAGFYSFTLEMLALGGALWIPQDGDGLTWIVRWDCSESLSKIRSNNVPALEFRPVFLGRNIPTLGCCATLERGYASTKPVNGRLKSWCENGLRYSTTSLPIPSFIASELTWPLQKRTFPWLLLVM